MRDVGWFVEGWLAEGAGCRPRRAEDSLCNWVYGDE
jgi:hypothetical protein